MNSIHSKVLFNPEIISMVFKHLNLFDIQNSRLVCRKWSEYGWTEARQNKACVRFVDGDEKVQNYINFFNKKTTTVSPLNNYVLSYDFKSGELLTKFYKQFGPHMRSLDISEYDNIELDHTDQKSLTCLEHFSFSCMEIEFPILNGIVLRGGNASLQIHDSGVRTEFLPELGSFLKQNSASLKRLEFDDEHSQWSGNQVTLVELSKIIVRAKFQHLKVLELPGHLDDACMLELASGNLRLVELNIGITEHSPQSFFKLLDSLRSTLKELSLYTMFPFVLKSERCMFPRMEKLSVLQFEKFEGSFDFLGSENFPVLEKLYITRVNFKPSDLTMNDTVVSGNHPGIQKLRICNIYMETIEHTADNVGKMIGALATLYPNLEDLFIWGKVAEEHLTQAEHYFPKLKKLTLSPECNLSKEDHATHLTQEIIKIF